MSSLKQVEEDKVFDVAIIGAGPAGLSALSAIQEPYELDNLTEKQQQEAARLSCSCCRSSDVVVIDPNKSWMIQWKQNFASLGIPHLRSTALAHPDLFDSTSLLAFAAEQKQQKTNLYESGLANLRELLPLGQSQIGLWKLPSTNLFQDFCDSMIQRLPHTFIQGSVIDIDVDNHSNTTTTDKKKKDKSNSSIYLLKLTDDDSRIIKARKVILATGTIGKPIIPKGLANAKTFPWTRVRQVVQQELSSSSRKRHILVVGGGLTAVQTAQACINHDYANTKVTLVSRRPLVERHMDLPLEWFDKRSSSKVMFDFYHQSIQERRDMIRATRGGGSVPPIYMKQVHQLERDGRLIRIVASNVSVISTSENEQQQVVQIEENDNEEKTILHVDAILLACGIQPDIMCSPLCQNLLNRWPIPIEGGFPELNQDLQWTSSTDIYVLGGLASLQNGPDSANLMGMRRAARVIARALGCRTWLQQVRANVYQNPFALLDGSSSDEDETEEETSSSSDDDESIM